MPLYTVDTLPTTSAEAIREFDDRYLAAQGVVQPDGWAETYGDFSPVSSPKVTFPISQVTGEYVATTGDSRYKTLQETSFDVKVEEFDLGYEAKLMDLFTEVYAYRKWKNTPNMFMVGEANHRAKKIAALLEANPTLWDGKALFATDHPANFFESKAGTFGNLQAAAKDPTDMDLLAAEITAMRGVKDENGEVLGVNPDLIFLPTAKFEYVKNKLNQSMIANAAGTASIDNPYKGGLTPIWIPQLTHAANWYLADSKMLKMLPAWAALKFTPPGSLGLRTFDESSDFFKTTGKIRVSSHIWYGFGAVFPHAIRKVTGA